MSACKYSRFLVILVIAGAGAALFAETPAVKKRSHLTVYLSEDDGATWRGGLLLCEGYGSYPDMFQAPDGRIYVSHDFGRADEGEIRLHSFTEEDVLAGKVVSSGSRLNRLVARVMGTSYNRKRFKR